MPAKRNITLAFPHQHPVYPHVAAAMRKILAGDGLKLKVLELSTMEILSGKHAEKIDIWLGGMSLSNYRDDAILSWFYNFDHIARAMPKNEFDELEHDVAHWRADQALESPCQNIGGKACSKRTDPTVVP